MKILPCTITRVTTLKYNKKEDRQVVYGVFGGCYSDWYIVGYFNNRIDADKYCCVSGDGD